MANDIPYTGPRFADQALVTRDEVQAGRAEVPQGTVPYTVRSGDNLWTIAKQNGFGDPPDMNAFYAQNQQYSQRNPDEIYPGEVVFVNPPRNGTAETGQVNPENGNVQYQNYKDGQPSGDPYYAAPNANGEPTSATTIGPDGQEVRVDTQGNPANGYYLVNGNTQGGTYAMFRDGARVEGDQFSVSWNTDNPRQTNPETGALRDGQVTEGSVTTTYERGLRTQTVETVQNAEGNYQRVTTTYGADGNVTSVNRGREFN